MNESLLQMKTHPDVYVKIFQEAKSRRAHVGDGDVYWSLIPLYGVARCPYCDTVYTEKMDTYTLRQWIVWGADGFCIFRMKHKSHCSHLVYAQSFTNLHGIIPQTSDTELDGRGLSLTSEVPHVVPFLLESDLETHSVLHSLPICRIEGDQFVPRYTLSMVTMFAPDPEPVLTELGKWGADMESWRSLLTFPPRSDYEDWYDLEPSLFVGHSQIFT
ncbi:MAG: hypothetical protein F9K24_21420 [Leptonema illini]|uniref:Uncharacterized protein n=1 Tax=Leptonema illini TaxID=183 RepID=A0A833GXH8_9LEPT|nr:MAG: hypothetical protein F9K24_21420 [Leptonema illini]